MVSEGTGPSRTYFQKPARSLCSLTRKKFWTGTPAPSPKTIPSMRKKGGKKNGSASRAPRRLTKTKERSLIPAFHRAAVQAHLALESKSHFRLIPHWNQFPISGSFLDWKMLVSARLVGQALPPANGRLSVGPLEF